MELVKKTAQELFQNFNSCYDGADVLGGSDVEKTIIDILNTPISFEDKLWLFYCGAFCGKQFFYRVSLLIADECNFAALPYVSLIDRAAEEQDEEKKKKAYITIASLAHKHNQKELTEVLKAEVMKALDEGTLYI